MSFTLEYRNLLGEQGQLRVVGEINCISFPCALRRHLRIMPCGEGLRDGADEKIISSNPKTIAPLKTSLPSR